VIEYGIGRSCGPWSLARLFEVISGNSPSSAIRHRRPGAVMSRARSPNGLCRSSPFVEIRPATKPRRFMLCHYEGQQASLPTSDDSGVRASHQVRD
jgi:hypothetical protein